MNFGSLTVENGIGQLVNINSPATLFGFLWDLFFGLGIVISLLFIIISGIKFATSAGDSKKFEEAKQGLIYAVVGGLVVILFTVILNLVLSVMGSRDIGYYLNQNGGAPIKQLTEADYKDAVGGRVLVNLGNGFTTLFYLLRNMGLALALLFVIIAGIKYATSAGNPDKVAEAQQTITWAIVGAVLAVFYYSILLMATNLLGIPSLPQDGNIIILPLTFFNSQIGS